MSDKPRIDELMLLKKWVESRFNEKAPQYIVDYIDARIELLKQWNGEIPSLLDIPIVLEPTLPDNTIEIRGENGQRSRIINVGAR